MSTTINRSNIQGLVFRSYGYPKSCHFFFRITEAEAARRFLSLWTPRVSHGDVDLTGGPEPMVHLALTWQGLLALDRFRAFGGDDAAANAFPADFRDGPDPQPLADHGESAPATWWNGRFPTSDVHLTIHAFVRTAAARDSIIAEIRQSAEAHGLRELVPTKDGTEPLSGQTLNEANGRELHFGYQDGFSQPEVNWEDDAGRGDLVDLRHFLLGYRTPAIESAPISAPWSDLVRDSSYLVLRWIHQDVFAFNTYLKEHAHLVAKPGMSPADAEEYLAAKMMGRWRDGTPLALSPDRQHPELATSPFEYQDDAAGNRCPFAAHIRVVNPRDQELDGANRSLFPNGPPRVIRRGHTYGPRLAPDVGQDDGVDRGIIGLFVCSNINKQFYTLTRWIGQTRFSPVFKNLREQDPLFGNRDQPLAQATFAIPHPETPVKLTGLRNFIRTQGTLLLLLPSIDTLRRLAADH